MIAGFSGSKFRRQTKTGKLTFEASSKMQIDSNPFPATMAGAMLPKGKTKVLTLARAMESGSVDTSLQVIAEELQEIKEGREKKEAQLEQLESSA
jgi:hypothetical protein